MIKYSILFKTFLKALGTVEDIENRKNYISLLDPSPKLHLEELREFGRMSKNWFGSVTRIIYSFYLKSNKQKEGHISYSLDTPFLLMSEQAILVDPQISPLKFVETLNQR